MADTGVTGLPPRGVGRRVIRRLGVVERGFDGDGRLAWVQPGMLPTRLNYGVIFFEIAREGFVQRALMDRGVLRRLDVANREF